MSLWSRITNVFRGDRLTHEIDEELQSHIDEAIEHGRDPAGARRAFGSALRLREESRDVRLITWLDSLRADAVFGWRQISKRKATSAAAILSLGLALGACTSAFRLIDALLLRPLPVAGAERLWVIAFKGGGKDQRTYDSCSYPMFRQMRAAVKDQAELMAVSYADRIDITYGSDQEMEKAYWQYVSGWMFCAFGLRPALGRLLTENDDLNPGAHPYAVLSYDYWTNRFGRDRTVVGRTLHMGNDLFQIVGVAPKSFTGTETGAMTDIFVPMMMKNPRTLASSNNFWLRTLVQLNPGVASGPVYAKLAATFRTIQDERAKGFSLLPQQLEEFLKEKMLLEHSPAGRSNLQRDYRQSLVALSVLVALVLLIACANVANLMMAQAAARAREMALRVSIGAGRRRLAQLVLVESALLAFLAAVVGAFFAWWSAPVVVSMINPPDNPARLALPADWRVLGFGLALTIIVMLLFGLAPALRASAINPSSALKGGEDPRARRRLMHALIAAQVAFCFLVLFVAGLLVTTFDRLSHQFTGFSAERILNLETVTQHPQPPAYWDQVSDHLRRVPGVETVAMVGWPLMSGESAVGSIAVDGAPSPVMSDFIRISPGWFETMRIPLITGRDFRANDAYPMVAIVNQAFAKQFLDGENPVGKLFERIDVTNAEAVRFQIVGYVADARSRDDMRLAIRPTAYVPFHAVDAQAALQPISRGTFVVRTSSPNPLSMAPTLRREVPKARPELRVSNIRTQTEINQSHTVRERLLARLAIFFGAVALLLAGIGLYGVLDFSVVQRRREIAIRMAIGAQAGDIARRVTVDVFSMVFIGALAGLALGFASVRYIGSLLYQVQPTDPTILALPALTIIAAALLAALPPVIHAMRTDPVTILRTD
ncbi:MAG TPA: ABC transporter permease [Terriglobia bacterium]|nr:ABC transporter permease [Terriglobia bacterium]